MTGTINKYKTYKVNYSTFGGIIYPSDFNTNNRGNSTPNGSAIAQRIISDKKWMENLIKNAGDKLSISKKQKMEDK